MKGKTKYLLSMGNLKRKDNSLCFRVDDKNNYIPITHIREIYCMNEISINTKLLHFLSQNNIVVHFFSYYGAYAGTFEPKERFISGKLVMEQVRYFDRDRMNIAIPIVKGIAKNCIEVLKHYRNHGKDGVVEHINTIKKLEKEADAVPNINALMFIEGQIWMSFYESFKYFLPENFVMNKRVKRPPDNPINALISFGNTLLYTKTITQIYHTHLDQSISFLHEPQEGRFSLCLDLCEVFKPAIVFKTIFDLVNTKQLTVAKHFDRKVNYCLLNENGKKIFLKAFEERMSSVFDHKKLKRKVSYETAIRYDGYKLIKTIVEDQEFKPFSLKELK